MRLIAKPVSNHRLQRLHRWAMLWLTWFAAFLDAAAEFAPISKAAHSIAHGWLDPIERLIICLVIARAAPRIRQSSRRKGVSEHRRIETSLLRAIVGSRMRRALRARDLHRRIAALRVNIGTRVAQMLKRLPCGLTRRRPVRVRPESNCSWPASATVVCAACADTS